MGLVAILALTAPRRLRLTRRELPYVATFGICGLAFVQWFYFLAIHRLAIGVALLIEYLAPLLVAFWVRFAYHEHVRRRIWVALGLALDGTRMIVDLSARVVALDPLASCSRSAAVPSRGTSSSPSVRSGDRDPVSLLAWGFFFASLFWAVLAPVVVVSPSDAPREHPHSSATWHPHHLPIWPLGSG